MDRIGLQKFLQMTLQKDEGVKILKRMLHYQLKYTKKYPRKPSHATVARHLSPSNSYIPQHH
jgi:hypothetical protein